LKPADTSFYDKHVHCGIRYSYFIHAQLAPDLVSSSDMEEAVGYDSILPAKPDMQYVSVKKTGSADGEITLEWRKSISSDVKTYAIYRSNDGGNWSPIAETPQLYFNDTNRNTSARRYYYHLQAVDSCENRSVPDPMHAQMVLRTIGQDSKIALAWDAYVGWTPQSYTVYKNGIVFITLPGSQTMLTDTMVVCAQDYTYWIEAAGPDSSHRSLSNLSTSRPLDTKAPPGVYIKTVTVSAPNDSVKIEWQASPAIDLAHYLVYRMEKGRPVLLDSTHATEYFTTIRSTESECFNILAKDICGNISQPGNTSCTIILSGKNEPGFNTLNWNQYKNWPLGIRQYNVYRKEDSAAWIKIGTTGFTDFKDDQFTDGIKDYCYQVEAEENSGGFSAVSRSTTICIHQDPVVWMPNAFSPNKDYLNEGFGPMGLYQHAGFSMQVFNRWGELVYSTTDGKPWDGYFKQAVVPEGVYFYKVTMNGLNRTRSYLVGTVMVVK
jgi:gliding motility-associated-like protein